MLRAWACILNLPTIVPVDENQAVHPFTAYGVSKLDGKLYCNLYTKVMSMMTLRYLEAYGRGGRKANAIPGVIN